MFTCPRLGIEFWAFGWQRNDADIRGYDECGGRMPPGLIHEHDCMATKRHGSSDFSKMQVHPLPGRRSRHAKGVPSARRDLPRGVRIAHRQDKPCALAQCRADCSEDVG